MLRVGTCFTLYIFNVRIYILSYRGGFKRLKPLHTLLLITLEVNSLFYDVLLQHFCACWQCLDILAFIIKAEAS